MEVDAEDIGWRDGPRAVKRQMQRTVSDIMRIRSFAGQERFEGFSGEIDDLLQDFEELNARDVERMRSTTSRSFEEKLYVLMEGRIQELILQAGVELGRFVNRGLLQRIGTVEQELPKEALEDWSTLDPGTELTPIELNYSLETMSLLPSGDESSWPGQDDGRAAASGDPGLQAMQAMMERVLDLLEAQDVRLSRLEREGSGRLVDSTANDLAQGAWAPDRNAPSSDPSLKALNLPSSFNVQFYEGSARLTLTAQLQLNEVMEYLGAYEALRVVCTGHADVTGDRSANLALSKKRAQAVRTHLLESGVLASRVVLNYFGEERAENRGALDRRVEVAFFVGD
jgi:outer membrane protein OmpA-like peptidoglycan-associated protein